MGKALFYFIKTRRVYNNALFNEIHLQILLLTNYFSFMTQVAFKTNPLLPAFIMSLD
jgi:hypothetical protein